MYYTCRWWPPIRSFTVMTRSKSNYRKSSAYSAGCLPFAVTPRGIIVLLGQERYDHSLSDFGGKCSFSDTSIFHTAYREFTEESLCHSFSCHDMFNRTLMHTVSNTLKGNSYFMFFVKFSEDELHDIMINFKRQLYFSENAHSEKDMMICLLMNEMLDSIAHTAPNLAARIMNVSPLPIGQEIQVVQQQQKQLLLPDDMFRIPSSLLNDRQDDAPHITKGIQTYSQKGNNSNSNRTCSPSPPRQYEQQSRWDKNNSQSSQMDDGLSNSSQGASLSRSPPLLGPIKVSSRGSPRWVTGVPSYEGNNHSTNHHHHHTHHPLKLRAVFFHTVNMHMRFLHRFHLIVN